VQAPILNDVYRHESEEEEKFEVIGVNIVRQEDRQIERIEEAKVESFTGDYKFDDKK
jgi:hypothetical protein